LQRQQKAKNIFLCKWYKAKNCHDLTLRQRRKMKTNGSGSSKLLGSKSPLPNTSTITITTSTSTTTTTTTKKPGDSESRRIDGNKKIKQDVELVVVGTAVTFTGKRLCHLQVRYWNLCHIYIQKPP
jgi:hypothetical protein